MVIMLGKISSIIEELVSHSGDIDVDATMVTLATEMDQGKYEFLQKGLCYNVHVFLNKAPRKAQSIIGTTCLCLA